jgi:membrane-bound lytic murein transglycosylase D
MRQCLTLLLILLFTVPVVAQQDTADDDILVESMPFYQRLDSMSGVLFQYYQASADHDSIALDSTYEFSLSDSVLKKRMDMLASPVPLVVNPTVKSFLKLYLDKRQEQLSRMIGYSSLYFPIFEQVLDKHGLPLELKYLPVIESALDPHAVSRVGATGLWQLMYPTGRMYGLTINTYVDQRRDPYSSSEAAARFLKDLYSLYGKWDLAIAAYNCGPGNVNKAIRRSGGKQDYWSIRKYLPRETRGYVPAFIAATYAMNYYSYHNIQPHATDFDFSMLDTVVFKKMIELKTIAKHLDMDEAFLSFINPALRRNIIPYDPKGGYELKLPYDKLLAFEAQRDTLIALADANMKDQKKAHSFGGAANYDKNKNYYQPNTDGKKRVSYTIKSGDNLGYIADWFDCTISEIKLWNGLRSSRIYAGKKLYLYVPEQRANYYAQIDRMNSAEKRNLDGSASASKIDNTKTAAGQDAGGDMRYIQYTIKSGDTLWDISKKYPKNSVDSLKRINNLNNHNYLKPGMVIKVAI